MNIRSMIEEGIKARLEDSAAITYPILLGQDVDERSIPAVVVYCPSSQATEFGLGNYQLQLEVHIFSNAHDTSLDDHRAVCAAVAGVLQDDAGIVASWPAELGILYKIEEAGEQEGKDADKLGNVIRYDVWACYPEA